MCLAARLHVLCRLVEKLRETFFSDGFLRNLKKCWCKSWNLMNDFWNSEGVFKVLRLLNYYKNYFSSMNGFFNTLVAYKVSFSLFA